jgi:hypothetical protein
MGGCKNFLQGIRITSSAAGEWAPSSYLVMLEDVVLFAAGALCATQAADKQNRHAQGHQDGQHICICREPSNCKMHKKEAHQILTPKACRDASIAIDHASFGVPVSRRLKCTTGKDALASGFRLQLREQKAKNSRGGARSQFGPGFTS